MAKIKVEKRVKRVTMITFAVFCYVLSMLCICAGIVGINASRQSLYSKQSINNNINKTVSTKDLMASFQRINAKREAEAKAKREAAERAKRLAEQKKAEEEARKAAASLGTTAPKGEIQQYAHDLAISSYGWNEADFSGLVKLWNRESGWNPNSYNSYSGACGIPQANPCSKIASAYGSNTWQNQVKWGLRYINNKYGSGSNAWAFFQSNGWY